MFRILVCAAVVGLCISTFGGVVEYLNPTAEHGQGFGNTQTIITLEKPSRGSTTSTGGVYNVLGQDQFWGVVENKSQTIAIGDIPDTINGFSLLANVNEADGVATLDWLAVYVQDQLGELLDVSWFTTDTAINGRGQGVADALFKVSYTPEEWQSFSNTDRIGMAASFSGVSGGAESFAIAPTPAAVPEPGSCVLLALGIAGMGAWRLGTRKTLSKDRHEI